MGDTDELAETALDGPLDALLRKVARVSDVRSLASSALRSGATLANGRFEILRRLGEGGMGVVYDASDAERKDRIALKTLTHVDAHGIYRLKNEFRALAEVRHPGLVRFHELFADNQSWFFTMELVSGHCFDTWLERANRFTLDPARTEIRRALAQLVEAVAAVHQAGKLHRDLKPSNVMVEESGRVVVLDFGLVSAPEIGGVGQTLLDHGVSGTPAYMAPEQAAGLEATEATDWYAVGVLLFEALAGCLPFEGRVGQILTAKQLQDPPSVLTFAPDAPEDLATLCAELLARDPSVRPSGSNLLGRLGADSPASSRRSVPAESDVTLIGRERELSALHAAYSASRSGGKPVVVMLTGESGIGKSALVTRFLGELRETTPAVLLHGRCYEREAVPFKAFDAIVDELSRYLRRLSNAEAAVFTPRDAWALIRLFPVLGRLPSFADAPARECADPHELRRRGFVAFGEVLSKLCDRAPLVLHIDDLQWTDADSIALLFHVLRQPDAPQLLFVGSQRDGQYEKLEPIYTALPDDIRLDFRQLGVEPLSPEDAKLLAGRDISPQVVAEARGNPFLLTEIARYARDTGARDIETRSLADLVLARCAALPDDAQRLLRAIALSAGSVPLTVVLQAAAAAQSAVDVLRDQQLVRRGVKHGEIECYHDKIRESVVAALAPEQARALHADLAAAWLCTKHPDPEQLALHHLGAGELQRAAECGVEAAERAAHAFAFERAAQLYALVLEIGDFPGARTHELRIAHADALAQAGRGVAAAEACVAAMPSAGSEEAADLARRAGFSYLQSGLFDLPLVNRGLAPYGLQLARTGVGAFLQLMWQRLLLRLRGYERRGQSRDAWAAERYAAAAPVSYALVCLDPVRAVTLETRLTRIALASGDPCLQARGMAAEVLNLMSFNTAREKVRAFGARAEALCEQSGDAISLLIVNSILGLFELAEDPSAAWKRFVKAREVLLANPDPSISHRMPWVSWNLLHARLLMQGAFGEVARQIPPLLDDAWAREHRGVTPFLAGVPGAIARVAVEDLAALRHDLARARGATITATFTWQDVILVQGELISMFYEHKLREAFDTAEQLAAKLSRSPARFSRVARADVRYLGAWARVAYAGGLAEGSERDRFVDQAATLLRQAGSAPDYSTMWQPPLPAAIAYLRGEREAAIALLEQRLRDTAEVDKFPAYTVFSRRRLGELLGGTRGADLIAQADRFLSENGVVDPARFVATLAPGFAPR